MCVLSPAGNRARRLLPFDDRVQFRGDLRYSVTFDSFSLRAAPGGCRVIFISCSLFITYFAYCGL